MVDPVLNDLQHIYQELSAGMSFLAAYERELPMPQTGNPRDVLSVGRGDPFAEVLGRISNAVLQTYGETVWKGITGPEDSPNFTDYWLWVEPGFSDALEEGKSYNFKIARYQPFTCGGGDFSYGVSIKVDKLSQ